MLILRASPDCWTLVGRLAQSKGASVDTGKYRRRRCKLGAGEFVAAFIALRERPCWRESYLLRELILWHDYQWFQLGAETPQECLSAWDRTILLVELTILGLILHHPHPQFRSKELLNSLIGSS